MKETSAAFCRLCRPPRHRGLRLRRPHRPRTGASRTGWRPVERGRDRFARRARDEGVRGPGRESRRREGRKDAPGEGVRREAARRRRPRGQPDALRHRLEHQGLHGHRPRNSRRGGKAEMGRPGDRLPPLVPARRPVRHPRDDDPRPPRAPQRPRARRGRPPLVAPDDLRPEGDRADGSGTSRSRRVSARRTPTTTCSTSWRAR